MTSEGLLLSALYGANAAIRNSCRAVCILNAALSNLVGYNNVGLRIGGTMTGPNFIGVGNNAKQADLTSFKVGGSSYTPGESAEDVVIQVLKYNGSKEAGYSWMDLDGDFEPGWYTEDYDPIEPNTVLFDAGDGLWVQGKTGLELGYCGQVLTDSKVTIPLRVGGTVCANPYPIELDITNISVGGESYAPGESAEDVVIQILKYNGAKEAGYSWMDLDGDFEPGWYTEDYDPIAEGSVMLPSGQGLWVQGQNGLELQISELTLN